jgi:hypothetical protein
MVVGPCQTAEVATKPAPDAGQEKRHFGHRAGLTREQPTTVATRPKANGDDGDYRANPSHLSSLPQ